MKRVISTILVVFVIVTLMSCASVIKGQAPRQEDGRDQTENEREEEIVISFNPAVEQKNENERIVKVNIELSESATSPIVVNWYISGGTAQEGEDFITAGEDPLVFSQGQKKKYFFVYINDDDESEDTETALFSFDVINPPEALEIGNNLFTLYINDNDTPSSPSQSPSSQLSSAVVSFVSDSAEVGEGQGEIDVCIELSESLDSALVINWQVAQEIPTTQDIAQEGVDYTAEANRTLVFSPGQIQKCFPVSLIDDSEIENTEIVIFEFSISSGQAEINNNRFTLSISDNDGTFSPPAPEFEFIYPKDGDKLNGKIEIRGNAENVAWVEIYYKIPGASTPVYLGNCYFHENEWKYTWDTSLTPNGAYELFAKIGGQYGEYTGSEIEIIVDNPVKTDKEAEESLKEEIQKGKEEVEKKEKEIIVEKKEIRKKVSERAKSFAERVKSLVREEIREVVALKIEKKLEVIDTEISQEIEEMVGEVKKVKSLEREIGDLEVKKDLLKKEISFTKDQLKKIEELKIQEGDKIKKEKIVTLEETIKEKLKIYQAKLKEIQEKLDSLQKELSETQKRKEENKDRVAKSVVGLVKSAEEISNSEEKMLISEAKKEIEKEINSYLREFESSVSQKEESKIVQAQVFLEDSDGDSLNNDEEIKIGTDLLNPDSDGDGFLDGIEYAAGYDPLNPLPEDKIIYEDARKVKPINPEIYKVERVEPVRLKDGKMGVLLEGRGLPNSFVTVYIYSYPIIMVTKTDLDGKWILMLSKPLADGDHEVYVAVTNNKGKIMARSEPFVFVKSKNKLAALTLASLMEGESLSQAASLQRMFFFVTISIIVAAVIIALVGIGFFTAKKEKKQAE